MSSFTVSLRGGGGKWKQTLILYKREIYLIPWQETFKMSEQPQTV